jgi:hypothetical protein
MRWKMTLSVALAAIVIAFACLPSASATKLQWQVVSSGGSEATSGVHKLNSTIGQIVAQPGSSGSHKLIHGFQQNFTASAPACTRCGDANNDGSKDISDVVYLIAYIFSGGAAPGECNTPNGLGDADGSGAVDISDVVYVIAYIFSGGLAPHCP